MFHRDPAHGLDPTHDEVLVWKVGRQVSFIVHLQPELTDRSVQRRHSRRAETGDGRRTVHGIGPRGDKNPEERPL